MVYVYKDKSRCVHFYPKLAAPITTNSSNQITISPASWDRQQEKGHLQSFVKLYLPDGIPDALEQDPAI